MDSDIAGPEIISMRLIKITRLLEDIVVEFTEIKLISWVENSISYHGCLGEGWGFTAYISKVHQNFVSVESEKNIEVMGYTSILELCEIRKFNLY